jgi:NAD(P)H-hydrate epimerase
MIEVDWLMIEEAGIGLSQMMENAGRSLAAVIRAELGGTAAGGRVVVFVGPGNNGGGGLVAARHLANAGAVVSVALSHAPPLASEVAEQQRRALERMGVPGSNDVTPVEAVSAPLSSAAVVVDALIGYSLHGAPREPIASLIHAANAASAPKVALDLPSGLDGDHGTPMTPTLQATTTLTLAWPKAGLLAASARQHVGNLLLADISIPAVVYRAVGVERGTLFAAGPIVRVRPVAGGWEVEELSLFRS